MSLAELSIKKPIFITCLVLAMLVVGWHSFKTLSVDQFPDVSFPTISVTTTYQGAGPAEIETLVTKPIEDEMSTISGVKHLSSKSMEGISRVTAEFKSSVDLKYAEQQVRDKVATAKAKLPRDAKEPVIFKMDPSDSPILKIAVLAQIPDGQLYDIADQVIKPRLEQVNNVGSIKIKGGRKREIHVALDREKLKERQLSVTDVANRLSAAGENIPGGKTTAGDRETSYRSIGEFRSVQDIATTLIHHYGNEVPTKVSDIGRVTDDLEDETSRVYVNGVKSLVIEVYRQSGTNVIDVVDNVNAELQQLEPILAQQNGHPKLEIVQDGSKTIRDNVDDVKETIILGILLTIVVVFIFLRNGRSTLITGLALPNSLIGSFILMKLAGYTINVISLLGLSLAVGLLIDDAIVVRENIFRRMENGEEPKKAAIIGTREVQLAIIATTLVIISMFAPVAFTSGMTGKFLGQFGLTICFAMLISLFDALTIAPMLSYYLAGKGVVRRKPESNGFFTNIYGRLIAYTVKKPLTVLGISFALFIVSSASLFKVPFTFMPEMDNGEISLNLELPPGANLNAMNRISSQADQILRQNKEVKRTVLTVGGSNDEAYKAGIFVQLVPRKSRAANTTEIKDRLRDQMKVLSQANPKIMKSDPGGNQSQPFALNLISQNQKDLEDYSTKLVARLKQDPRLQEVDSNYRAGKPELQIVTNPKKAQFFGINTGTLGQEIRAQVEGVTPAKFRENGREYDVRVRLLPQQRELVKNLDKVYVPNIGQRLIKLTQVAQVNSRVGAASIDRQERGRYIQVTANLLPRVGLGDVINDVNRMVQKEMPLPSGMRMAYSGESENIGEMAGSLVIAIGFGIMFVFFVLASLYESFVTPLTIMLALPLAVCGAFVGLFLANETLSLFAILGIIMLLGVACKNSILLVDCTHQLIASGRSRTDALVEACKLRLRPIMMTSLALIAGSIPVAIGLNEASKQRTAMGVVIIGGIISSTLLTLVVVPAVFSYIDRFRVWSSKWIAKAVDFQRREN
ncbi:MAG: transporter [Bdellovibrionales bacterium RIFOXYD1_FULL_53_11]|nr:MAG: transporter [Bdellovibrionales bacterium RIFOXYD1_FULL_53_11]